MKRARPLSLESLEERLVPSTIWNVPWPNSEHITLSFAPDGTTGGLSPSNLFSTLNRVAPTNTWEMQILQALQTWAVNGNINIGVVTDGGEPLGGPGAVQGDSRFGDVRIAGTPESTNGMDNLAATQPFSFTGTTWSGDMVFNTSNQFAIGNVPGAYDLFSVALHEAGHVFGLPDESTNPGSVMYAGYQYLTGLSPADIASLQSLYGARQYDSFNQGGKYDNSFATATPLNAAGQGIAVGADITTLNQSEYFEFTTPSFLTGFSGFNAQVQTSGISLLMPSLTVYTTAGQAIGSSVAANPLNGNLSVHINASPSTTYYVRVTDATSSVFGIGSYQLSVVNQYPLVSLGGIGSLLANSPITKLLNNTLATATNLLRNGTGQDLRFDYLAQGTITSPTNTIYCQVESDPAPSGGSETLVAMAWALSPNGLNSRIHVFNASMNPVPLQVIANNGGTYTIQVANVTPNAPYYLEVVPASTQGAQSVGSFFLAVNFHQQELASFDTLASAAMSQATLGGGSFSANQNQLFYFALSASTVAPGSGSQESLTMTLVNAAGQTALSLTVGAGQPTATADIYLAQGTYSVEYSVSTPSGSSFQALDFILAGDMLSNPLGAYTTNGGSSHNSPYAYSGPGSSSTASSSGPPSYY